MRTTCAAGPRTFDDWARADNTTTHDIVAALREDMIAMLTTKSICVGLAREGRPMDFLPLDVQNRRDLLKEVAGLAIARALAALSQRLAADSWEPWEGKAAASLAVFTRRVLTQIYRPWFNEEFGYRDVEVLQDPNALPRWGAQDFDALLVGMLATLPQEVRSVALLRGYEFTQPEIAIKLQISQSTVSRRLAICRA